MKRVLLVVLLLGMVFAGSALEKSDFSYEPQAPLIELTNEYKPVNVFFSVERNKGVNAYGITVQFIGPASLQAESETLVLDIIKLGKQRESRWQIKANEAGSYDLSDSFMIISWDDSVSLQLNEIPRETSKSEVEINATTDDASLCKEHNFVGFWGEQENCRVKVVINGNEYWADEDGRFSMSYELQEGENILNIKAQDPGGNTKSEVRTITYTPPVTEKYGLWMLFATGIAFSAILLFVLKRVLGMRKIVDEAKQTAIEAVGKAHLEDVLDAEKKMLITYTQTGGSGAILKELVPVWKKIIELSPELSALTGNESKEETLKVLQNVDPYIQKLPAGVRIIIVEQYFKLIRDKAKGRKSI